MGFWERNPQAGLEMALGSFKGRAPSRCSLGDTTTFGFQARPPVVQRTTWCVELHGAKSARRESFKIRRKPWLSSALKKQPEPCNNTAKNPFSLAVLKDWERGYFVPHLSYQESSAKENYGIKLSFLHLFIQLQDALQSSRHGARL